MRGHESNILIVDDYEMVPESIQRKIEDLAESNGALAKIVLMNEEMSEEDREMDELMKRV